MNNDIPLKYYDIVEEYASESAKPVGESELDALAHYFQQEMATEAGISAQRIDEIANFLNEWGNE